MIRDILKKYIIPGGIATMTADSWYQSRFGPNSPTVVQAEREKALANYNSAQEELLNTTKTLQDYQDRDVLLQAKANIISEGNNAINSKVLEIEDIKKNLMEPGLSESKKIDFQRQLDYKNSELIRSVKEHTNSMSDFTNDIKKGENLVGNQSDIVSNSVNTSQDKVLDSISKVTDSTELDSIDVKQNNVLGSLSEIRQAINDELASLTPEELACLTNLLGFIMVLGGMITITLILFGEYLINYFKLDQRYPKLAKYIKLRQKVNKYYLIVNFIIIYLIIIIYIVLNFYMFIM
uniref:Uncharacterized protein n=1 Tax=Taiwanofungus camphoratus TaxID=2696576 RepID=A0A4D6SWC2_TAICA|nr:hypothetical protein [Taiwanofungus camphoratus]QCG70020.1 hypothetical protein [Taiwanofungus camphoratus]UKQ56110.1 hypothetical protein [Taiwanofungus camphoratus]WRO45221.1 hypothetical protein [Taiwanofungus sp. YW-2023a]